MSVSRCSAPCVTGGACEPHDQNHLVTGARGWSAGVGGEQGKHWPLTPMGDPSVILFKSESSTAWWEGRHLKEETPCAGSQLTSATHFKGNETRQDAGQCTQHVITWLLQGVRNRNSNTDACLNVYVQMCVHSFSHKSLNYFWKENREPGNIGCFQGEELEAGVGRTKFSAHPFAF